MRQQPWVCGPDPGHVSTSVEQGDCPCSYTIKKQTSTVQRQHKLLLGMVVLIILDIYGAPRGKDIYSLNFCNTVNILMVAQG